MTYKGGCLCEAIRYRAERDPVETGYCHCYLCRRSTGGIVAAYASFPVESFQYTSGEPSIFPSSTHGHREFCNQCGTQIAYRRSENAETIDVNSSSLDDLSTVKPQHHIYTGSSVPWLQINDDLPRYKENPNKQTKD